MATALAETTRPPRSRWFTVGLLDRYLLRGAAGPFLIVLLAVTVALMLERALRLIHEMAATGSDISFSRK